MQITDPRAMRALAHPLRLDLVELLTVLGTATAATCARHLDTSQASCSFHLRQLAKYGFVEQAPDSDDRRQRPWRLVDLEQSWSSTQGGAAAAHLDRAFAQREADRMIRWATSSEAEPASWRKAAFTTGATLPVTADELRTIGEQLREVLAPYVRRLTDRSACPPEARFVRIMLAATPLPAGDHADLTDGDHGADND